LSLRSLVRLSRLDCQPITTPDNLNASQPAVSLPRKPNRRVLEGQRLMTLALCVLLIAPLGQGVTAPDEAAVSKASLERIVADRSEFEISAAVKPPQKLRLSGEPVLRWNYPSRNVDDAALFIWLGKDRPEV